MRIFVNGEAQEHPGELTLAQLVEQIGLDPRYLVVEHNGEPVARDRHEDLTLREDDRLELVRPVAGG